MTTTHHARYPMTTQRTLTGNTSSLPWQQCGCFAVAMTTGQDKTRRKTGKDADNSGLWISVTTNNTHTCPAIQFIAIRPLRYLPRITASVACIPAASVSSVITQSSLMKLLGQRRPCLQRTTTMPDWMF